MALSYTESHISLFISISLADMKRIPGSVPPRPISRTGPQEKIEVQILSTFYGVVYTYNTESKWQAILPDYIKIELHDCGGDLASRYKLLAVQSGGQVFHVPTYVVSVIGFRFMLNQCKLQLSAQCSCHDFSTMVMLFL